MKTGFFVILILAAGAAAAHLIMADTGYVLINFRGYIIEMSVPVLVVLLVLGYLAIRLLVRVWRMPRWLGEAYSRARIRYAGRQATNGYIALAEGRLARGERLLTRGARRSETPLLNYLAAARAAQMQGDRERRDGWLRMAAEHEPAAMDAVLLTQAELQLENGQYAEAKTSLDRVRERHPTHPQAQKLLAELHFRRQEWSPLAELLPALRRRGNVPPEVLDEWSVAAYGTMLAAPGLDRQALDRLWDDVPRTLRRHPRLVATRANGLLAVGAVDDAEGELRRVLRDNWNEELVTLYGELQTADPAAHLKRIEAWLKERPQDPALLLAAGRASVHHQLWGKARSYLEASIGARPAPETYQVLGQLMARLGEAEPASRAFEKGLSMSPAGRAARNSRPAAIPPPTDRPPSSPPALPPASDGDRLTG